MKKIGIVTFALLCPMLADAGWVKGMVDGFYVTPTDLRVSVTGAGAGTCSSWNYEFRLPNTSTQYEDILATVIAAHISKVDTTVWYTDSTAPGTTQTNGCTESSMAVITALGMADF
ncbi:MAG: hypothetical protein AAF290_07385 [Pseudomonadota bacterium]